MAAMGRVWSGAVLGRFDGMIEAMTALGAAPPSPEGADALVNALGAVVMTMTLGDMHDQAAMFLARMEEVGAPYEASDPAIRGWMELARGYRARHAEADVYGSLCHMRSGAASFAESGSPQERMWLEVHAGIDYWHLGAHAEAERAVAKAIREPPAGTKLRVVASVGLYVLANVLSDAGRHEDARARVIPMIEAERAQGNRYLEGMGRSTLAQILRRRGDLEAAAAEATTATEILVANPSDRAMALAILSSIRRDQGRAAEALELAREACGGPLRLPVYGTALIRLAHVEALAIESPAAARAALADLTDWLVARAAAIADPALRASFLERVPPNARAFALARAWQGGSPRPAAVP
jgi:tetratricopeptide (TPR) repeat protein